MPKLKTHRGAAKRFRATKTGKFKFARAGRRHLLECKAAKINRKMRKSSYVHPADEAGIRALLPYA